MKIISRYLSVNIISTILIANLVLLALAIFISFAGEFSDIGTGNYNFLHSALYVLLLLPTNVALLFPMAGLLGTLAGLGLLAARSELIVMRAAGVSLAKITRIVLVTAFTMALIAFVVGEIIAPYSQHLANNFKAHSMSSGQLLYSKQGVWLRNNKNYIHVDKILPNQELYGITVYQFDNNYHLLKITFAAKGAYQANQWIFNDINESLFTASRVISVKTPSTNWNIKFKPHLLDIINVDTNERTLPQLYQYIKYLHKMGLQTNGYSVAFWQRILAPLSTIVMILLAIPFIFGPLRSATMGLRMVSGILFGFVFYVINLFIGPISVLYQIQPFLVSASPIVLVAIIGGFLLFRAQ